MERILIVRLGAMGDILHALPAVSALHAAQPAISIDWVVEQKWLPLLCSPEADSAGSANTWSKPVIYRPYVVDTKWMRRHLFSKGLRRHLEAQRQTNRQPLPRVVIDLQGSIKSALCARWLGGRRIAGPASPRESIARWAYDERVETHAPHVIDQAWEIVQQATGHRLPPLPKDRNDCLPRNAADEAWVEAAARGLRVALLNPAAGWGAKQWPATRYGELAARLSAQGMRVLVNQGPGEEQIGQEVLRASGGAASAVSCTLSRLIALTRQASLFVGGDTGPMHLAAMLGVPAVALFGPTDPARNGPYYERTITLRSQQSRTSYSHVVPPDPGLTAIGVDEVVAAVQRVMG